MGIKKPLDRRTFLRGAGVAVALPFLEAMLPSLAWAAGGPHRLVAMYGGVPTYFGRDSLPVGALGTNLITSIKSLEAVRQHVTVLTNMRLPQHTATPSEPGSAIQQQHYTAPAPILAGVSSMDAKPMMDRAHTIDQVFADAKSAGSKLKSIQACVQALPYNGTSKTTASGGQVSSRYEAGRMNVQPPIVSPVDLWTKLFSTTATPTVPSALNARKSVLDLVLDDANRLSANLSAADKVRMDQHFQYIRDIEKTISSTPTGGGATCTPPAKPGAPTNPSTQNFGGWADETTRRNIQADILALAIACDITRAVSWQLSYDQCWIGSLNITGVNSDLHQISHDVNNDTTGKLQLAMKQHFDWHMAGLARLVAKLASLPEGGGTVLDTTFIGMGFGEGISAHGRNQMHMVIAGLPGQMKMGQHIAGAAEHPARVWISALNAMGVATNKLGEVSGMMNSILK